MLVPARNYTSRKFSLDRQFECDTYLKIQPLVVQEVNWPELQNPNHLEESVVEYLSTIKQHIDWNTSTCSMSSGYIPEITKKIAYSFFQSK